MLQQDEADDYVVATGETHSIRELLDIAFARVGIDDWRATSCQDPRFFRPAEVDLLIGDPTKAHEVLGWKPKVGFGELVEMMVDADLAEQREPARERDRMTTALITGITGQDGSYLAERLLADGVEVHGLVRDGDARPTRCASPHGVRSQLARDDLADGPGLRRADPRRSRPTSYTTWRASARSRMSWQQPLLTGPVSGLGGRRSCSRRRSTCRSATGRPVAVVQASSAEIFGEPDRVPQDESTPCARPTPYGAAKAYAHHMSGVYRVARPARVSSCILFNHESPRRPDTFVTRKITQAAARIAPGADRRHRAGQPRRAPRLGLGPGLRRRDVRAVRHDRPTTTSSPPARRTPSPTSSRPLSPVSESPTGSATSPWTRATPARRLTRVRR